MTEIPENRCGETFSGMQHYNNSKEIAGCCCRETLADNGKCAWHAHQNNTTKKSFQALADSRVPSALREITDPYGEILDWATFGKTNLKDDFSFSDISLRNAHFYKTNLEGCDFSGADLKDAYLYDSNLQNADLSNTDLRGADLTKADLAGADLSGSKLNNADLTNANLNEADLKDAICDNTDFSSANLSGADIWEIQYIHDVDFRNADMTNADLGYLWLNSSNFEGADLSGANFESASLRGTNFKGANMSKTNLRSSYLQKANFEDIKIDDPSNVHVNSKTDITYSVRSVLNIFKDFKLQHLYWSGFRHSPIFSRYTWRWDRRARGYERLRQVFRIKSLEKQQRTLHSYQRRARAKEALRDYRIVGWFGNYLSRFLTGHGVNVFRVLLWSLLILIIPGYWYSLIDTVANESLVGGPFYYSVVTFVTAPPTPLPENIPGSVELVGHSISRDAISRWVVLLQTYIGTVLIVLLGYVLGNRDTI